MNKREVAVFAKRDPVAALALGRALVAAAKAEGRRLATAAGAGVECPACGKFCSISPVRGGIWPHNLPAKFIEWRRERGIYGARCIGDCHRVGDERDAHRLPALAEQRAEIEAWRASRSRR